jgi:proline iminopeptidase
MDSHFEKLASPGLPGEQSTHWREPSELIQIAGSRLALWCEYPRLDAELDSTPWLVLHGGPGSRMGADLVAPLRRTSSPWWAFDQRGSGLSEAANLPDLDTERLVDDALALAQHLGLRRFHVLGGSWGATLALCLAARAPDQVASLVLRAPFIPFRPRVDAYFLSLKQRHEALFIRAFGRDAHCKPVCDLMQNGQSEQIEFACRVWSFLDSSLLRSAPINPEQGLPDVSAEELTSMVRKFKVQAHFLMHDCFISPQRWVEDVAVIHASAMPVSIVQGCADTVCPPGGARFLAEMLPFSQLIELPNQGHLAGSPHMISALAQAVQAHRRPTAKIMSLRSRKPQ